MQHDIKWCQINKISIRVEGRHIWCYLSNHNLPWVIFRRSLCLRKPALDFRCNGILSARGTSAALASFNSSCKFESSWQEHPILVLDSQPQIRYNLSRTWNVNKLQQIALGRSFSASVFKCFIRLSCLCKNGGASEAWLVRANKSMPLPLCSLIGEVWLMGAFKVSNLLSSKLEQSRSWPHAKAGCSMTLWCMENEKNMNILPFTLPKLFILFVIFIHDCSSTFCILSTSTLPPSHCWHLRCWLSHSFKETTKTELDTIQFLHSVNLRGCEVRASTLRSEHWA